MTNAFAGGAAGWRAAIAIGATAVLGSVAASAHVAEPHSKPLTTVIRSANASTHLYVAAFDKILAYPLAQDGLPATTPDWELDAAATSVALDGAGYVYAASANAGVNEVRVYAPSASGADPPIQVIRLPGETFWIAVNKTGYLFVEYNDYDILFYAPVAGVKVPRPIRPLHTIKESNFVNGLFFDQAGHLYVVPYIGPVAVYDDPVHNWQSPSRLIGPRDGEPNPIAPAAVNEANGDVYMKMVFGYRPVWKTAHVGRSMTNESPDRISLSRACNTEGITSPENGLVVNTNYLIFSCSSPGGVQVYRNAPGKQRVVETLPDGDGLVFWP